ncbi:hypothetical protein [Diaphorobacter caeni]|uniref:hypothetical protein n=1 Tax=Diaphorobacter caeni TaxID=2784387 RepID=UPI00188F2556|nr:hypothetical protein [Diaphorobacter caeni]MBF5006867.1 hypothetical protein [Diaphorobacter caeni]
MSRETVDQLIQRVMAEHPGSGPRDLAKYFEAVHQELAPLARELEAENHRMREQLRDAWTEQKALRTPRGRSVFTCPGCGNVYRAGEQNVTIYADSGRAKCRSCDSVLTESEERRA